ncbi:MAG: MobA/MobL family protein [Defluviitaleaceae bacterium]|nr:MobA/MobL family protein [Defluviitaleaceae bacterium]
MKNEYTGKTHDYSAKKGIVFEEIMLPKNAPNLYKNRAILWNAVEQNERAVNAQLAREIEIALPNEFDIDQNSLLVQEYVYDNFVAKGMCADICIHDTGTGNKHAHILLTMRPFEDDGTWGAKARKEFVFDDNGERVKLQNGRYKTRRINTTDWDDRSKAEEWRSAWANLVNDHLQHFGHEQILDHRSYARQNKEQIPTIHLGAISHSLEQKGIATERGDKNRAIKAANERINAINKQLHEIKNPPKPKLIIDLEKSIKAENSPAYTQWIKIFNLQQSAQTLLFLQESSFDDMETLQAAHATAQNNFAEIQKQISETKAAIKSIKAQKEQVEIYRNTKEIYEKHIVPGQFSYFKNDYYNRHKTEIEAHKKAKAYIFNELKLAKFPSLKKLSAEISELSAKEKSLPAKLKNAREEINALKITEQNVNMLLGYNALESKGFTPTIPTRGLRFSMPYEYSYEEAEKSGETEAYFQGNFLDAVCASEIHKKVFGAYGQHEYEKAAEEILTKYGQERAERVVAAIVNTSPEKLYASFRKWASQKEDILQDEPSARNKAIFSEVTYGTNNMVKFLDKFKTAAESMRVATFQTERGTVLSSALPRELAKPQPPAQNSDDILRNKNSTFSQKMAAAQQKVKEQDLNPPPRKRNNYDHEI